MIEGISLLLTGVGGLEGALDLRACVGHDRAYVA